MQALDDDEVDSPRRRVRHKGASDRLLRKARHLIDLDDVMSLAQGPIGSTDWADQNVPAESIREKLRDLGTNYQDNVIATWAFLYAGARKPAIITSSQQSDMWRKWFDDQGLAPATMPRVQTGPAPPFEQRATPGYTAPAKTPEPVGPSYADRAVSAAQIAQSEAVDAWRAAQTAALRSLWAQSFQEGVANFAAQYPELATDDLMAELDAEDDPENQMSPHLASVGKMVGQLTNLLMLAPAADQIAQWFGDNEHRVQSQAETLAWQAEQKGYAEAGSNFGLEIEWQSEGDDRVCDDCSGLEAGGPYTDGGDNPLPAFPGDGSTICGPNCRCSLNYLEPDGAGLAQPGFDGGGAGGFDQSSDQVANTNFDAGALVDALGVDALQEVEGYSALSTFDEIAARTRNFDSEAGFAIDRYGKIIDATLGNADSISFTPEQLQRQHGADLVVHNHPQSASFSATDIAFAFSQEVGEMRVVSPLWDYHLKPLGSKHFIPTDAVKVMDVAQSKVEQLYPVVKEKATALYHAQFEQADVKHMSYGAIFKAESANFWHDVWSQTADETGLFKYARTPAAKLEQMVHVEPAHVTKAQINEHNLKAIGQMPLSFPKGEDDLLAMSKTTGPSGSQEGYWLKGKTGEKYYVKPMDSAHAANEVGAMRAYELAGAIPGIDIPYVNVIQRVDDKPVVVSRFIESVDQHAGHWWDSSSGQNARFNAQKFFGMDALLSHYDVVGLVNDNMLVHAMTQNVLRVETGGAMQFRATGAAKAGWKVGASWVDPWTLRGIAHDGVPGGEQAKSVFGNMSNENVATRLGALKTLDLETLDQAWKDLGMNTETRLHNMAVIKSRIAQIPAIQAQLGMATDAAFAKGQEVAKAVQAQVATPPAIASKINYKPWSSSGDQYGKKLAVTFKPWFEEFKKFSPVAGVSSNVIKELASGVTFPAHAVSQGPAKIARLELRVAFARSYNYALYDQKLAPEIKAFWTEKLGLVDKPVIAAPTESVSVQHVIENWVSKGAPVEKAATALPLWDPKVDPLGHQFVLAHPDYIAAVNVLPSEVQTEIADWTSSKDFSKGIAGTYNAYLIGPDSLAGDSQAIHDFWKKTLGSLPAQTQKVYPTAPVAKTEAAVKSAIKQPWDDTFAAAKEELSKGADAEDVLAELGHTFVQAKGLESEWMEGLVKFGIVGNEESAANIIADWIETAKSFEPDVVKVVLPADFKEKVLQFGGEDTRIYRQMWQHIYMDEPMPVSPHMKVDAEMVQNYKTWFEEKGLEPGGASWESTKDQLGPDAHAESFAKHFPNLDYGASVSAYTQDAHNLDVLSNGEDVKAWMQAHGIGSPALGPPTKEWLLGQNSQLASYLPLTYNATQGLTTEAIDAMWEQYKTGHLTDGDSWHEAFATWEKNNASWQGPHEPLPVIPLLPYGDAWTSFVAEKGGTKETYNAVWDHIYAGGPPPPGWTASSSDLIPAWKTHFEKAGWAPGGKNYEAVKAQGNVAAPVSKLPEISTEKFDQIYDQIKDVIEGEYAPNDVQSLIGAYQTGMSTPKFATWFDEHFPEIAPHVEPAVEKEAFASTLTPQMHDELWGKFTTVAWNKTVTLDMFDEMLASYQAGTATENIAAWFEKNAPELQVAGKELGATTASATTFSGFSKTLLAWSPTNDKWAKQFGKAHPKLYNSFSKAFKGKAWVRLTTEDLKFPAYALKNPVKVERLRTKVALARTYNLAVKGDWEALANLDPKLPTFWKDKLGDLQPAAKPVLAINASLANLNAVKEELRTSQTAWYPDFRTTFGHTMTLKIVPELENAGIVVPPNSTKERELRALAFAKSYLMAKANDVAGLKAIDEKLLYWWDDKLGGGLVPRVAVSLEGAPWVHDYNAMYPEKHAVSATDAKYSRSTRASAYNAFKQAIHDFTNGAWTELRTAAKAVLKGAAGGHYGAEAKALIEAIQDAPANAPLLTRRESWADVARRAGSTRDGLEAFFKSKIADAKYTFNFDLVSTQYTDHWSGDLKWVIEKGSKAIYAKPSSSHSSENEWIAAGRYKILKVQREGGDLVVYVRQASVFDLPE